MSSVTVPCLSGKCGASTHIVGSAAHAQCMSFAHSLGRLEKAKADRTAGLLTPAVPAPTVSGLVLSPGEVAAHGKDNPLMLDIVFEREGLRDDREMLGDYEQFFVFTGNDGKVHVGLTFDGFFGAEPPSINSASVPWESSPFDNWVERQPDEEVEWHLSDCFYQHFDLENLYQDGSEVKITPHFGEPRIGDLMVTVSFPVEGGVDGVPDGIRSIEAALAKMPDDFVEGPFEKMWEDWYRGETEPDPDLAYEDYVNETHF